MVVGSESEEMRIQSHTLGRKEVGALRGERLKVVKVYRGFQVDAISCFRTKRAEEDRQTDLRGLKKEGIL
jgi:hypothetical protein